MKQKQVHRRALIDPKFKLRDLHARITQAQLDRMTAIRETYGIPFTRMVRDALDLYFKRYKQ